MTTRTVAHVRCDGCDREAVKEPHTSGPPGWRHLEIRWGSKAGHRVRKVDVCDDPMCAARAVDLTRDDEADAISPRLRV